MTNRIFDTCVRLLEFGAKKLGISYKAINVAVFCVIWPAITIALIAIIVLQNQVLNALLRPI